MKIITLSLDDDVFVVLGSRWSWTRVCVSVYRPETRQRSNIWGVAEAMLSQVGRLTEPGRRVGGEREQDCSECLLEQVRWSACLRQRWSFHLRSSGFYIPAMHHRSHHAEEVLQASDSQSGAQGCGVAIYGDLRAAGNSSISSEILHRVSQTERDHLGISGLLSGYLGNI